jgi:hypothetical protein
MSVRVPRATLVLVVGLTVGVVAVGTVSSLSSSLSSSLTGAAHPGDRASRTGVDRRPLAVLHEWDARRAAAWAAGDARALAGLYTDGSSAGAADVRLQRRYSERGLRVRSLRMQVLAARVVTVRPRRVELEVTDRLASATAVRRDDPGTARELPSDAATTRHVVLLRVDGVWRVDRVWSASRR